MSKPNDCNADLGHPCDAGGRGDNDDPIPCERCIAEEKYWRNYFRGMPVILSEKEYREQMIDAGRGRLLGDW